MSPRKLLLDSFGAALGAADPIQLVPQHLPPPPRGRTLVVGAGKAAASMAFAVEKNWPINSPLGGLVITRYGHSLPTTRIRVIEAGHPVPDKSGERAAREIYEAVKTLGSDDLLLCLVSGGGSSLLSLPVSTVSMLDLKGVTKELLRCGATIQEINTVRKHLSLIQGGRLAALCRAQILALVISDVTGDDPTHIASGPCAPDLTTYGDALAILERYKVNASAAVIKTLNLGCQGKLDETPKPGNSIFRKVENRVIATAHASLVSAGHFFRRHGIAAAIVGDSVTGESREVAKVYGALAREVNDFGHPWKKPLALISGGETTVTVTGSGRGGRNCEFLLSLMIDLFGTKNIYSLACDTDGIDGSEDNAGALITPYSLTRAANMGLNAEKFLENNDAYGFFEKLGDLIITKPTRTNVNDYRAILLL